MVQEPVCGMIKQPGLAFLLLDSESKTILENPDKQPPDWSQITSDTVKANQSEDSVHIPQICPSHRTRQHPVQSAAG